MEREIEGASPPRVGLILGVALAAVGALITALVIAAHANALWSAHLNDLGRFYYSTRAWLDGGAMYGENPATPAVIGGVTRQLYDLNPPHFHLAMWPVAGLSLAGACAAWLVTSALGAGLSVAWAHRSAQIAAPSAGWLAAGALWWFGSFPFLYWLTTGQVTFQLLPFVVAAWLAARDDRWAACGLALGLLTAIKPFFALIVVWAVLRGGWRAGAAAAAACAACFGVGAAVFGPEAYREWVEVLGAIDWYELPGNGSIRGFLERSLRATPALAPLIERPELVRPLWWASFVGVGAIAMGAALRDRGPRATDRAFAQLLVASFLLSPLGWAYYTPWALLPVAALYLGAGAQPGPRWRAERLLLAGAAALLFVPRWVEVVAVGDAKHPLLTVTLASSYFWAHVLLWLALVVGARFNSAR